MTLLRAFRGTAIEPMGSTHNRPSPGSVRSSLIFSAVGRGQSVGRIAARHGSAREIWLRAKRRAAVLPTVSARSHPWRRAPAAMPRPILSKTSTASRTSIADCTNDPRRAPDPARRRARVVAGRRSGRCRCAGRVPERVGTGTKTDRVSGATGRRLVGPSRPPVRSCRTVSCGRRAAWLRRHLQPLHGDCRSARLMVAMWRWRSTA